MQPAKKGYGSFHYYLGVQSLAQLATKDDRVCVINILGTESKDVTPTSNVYSGGNVVFGTQPGRGGQALSTSAGDIPVFNNVREGLDAGLTFNTGVVYLPPAGVRDAVYELARVNPDLRKIIIVTEKSSVRSAREIRAIAQHYGIDVFGANCLGVADAWNHVRLGGALGGDTPEESLKPGSIAIYSNSGNFTTTMANYLNAEGWGTTTLVSSGKDRYIHFAVPEFGYCFDNDPRSKAAVLYIEPGGYYEHDVRFTKPVVACVVGRWKSRLTRAVGHAGALAGSGDDASAKEQWFMDAFGVNDLFTPENPVCSAKGAVVINISHIPAALSAVMKLNGQDPDYPSEGNLSLKPWFGNNQGLNLPTVLDIPIVSAMSPYDVQIDRLNCQIGAMVPRQTLKDASGASQMNEKSQVTRVHGVSVLEASRHPFAANLGLAILREYPTPAHVQMLEIAVAAEAALNGDPALAAAEASREAGNAPNTVLAAAASVIGPKRAQAACAGVEWFVDNCIRLGLTDPSDINFPMPDITDGVKALFLAPCGDIKAERMLTALKHRGLTSVFLTYLSKLGGAVSADAVLAAIVSTVGWNVLCRKRITRLSLIKMPWHLKLCGAQFGAAVPAAQHGLDRIHGVDIREILSAWTLSDVAYLALTGQLPDNRARQSLDILMGLLISNGPGTISGQGAKGAVSADGPERPDRVQVNKCMIGMLTHTGFAHGGNGFEGIRFLLDRFADTGLSDPGDANHGLNIKKMADDFVATFAVQKGAQKAFGTGESVKIPCISHPIFKGQEINIDPREAFVTKLLAESGEYNVFHEFYKCLVWSLKEAGVSRDVYCVNIDAVIACLLLKLLWVPYRAGLLSESDLERAAFTIFLFGRIAGTSAEIDDHTNRGKDMDMRTPASRVRFVS